MEKLIQAKRYIERRWPHAMHLHVEGLQAEQRAQIGNGVAMAFTVAAGPQATIVSYDVG